MSQNDTHNPSEMHDLESKPGVDCIEELKSGNEKPPKAGADYSGAVRKTDAKEIALVRKLDWRIMPILWVMYFLNYVSRL
jgi:hypothetical protein